MSAVTFTHLCARTPALDTPDTASLREQIRFYFDSTFTLYERLFDTLACDEAYYKKPISLRHPLIFYFGHTATFFINKFLLARLIDTRINARFESLFAVGVDEMSWDDLNDAHYDWPTVAEVADYRKRVRQTVLSIIDNTPLTGPITWDHPWWAIIMGVEHERIHLETSSVLIRQHSLDMVKPQAAWAPCRQHGPAPSNRLLPVSAGDVALGKDWQDPYYGWDNEYGHHQPHVDTFQASEFLVSNQEYLAFVEADGYSQAQYWSDEGWHWRTYSCATMPTFWRLDGDQYRLRLMTEEVAMPWNWPVEVNCLEAEAFCRWLSATSGQRIQLPTEDQWHRLADVSERREVPLRTAANANIHLDHYASSCPVDQFQHGDFYDVSGNVWQWTQTPTYPFPGFDVHGIYDDFTTPTFDDRHNLMMGGSWISCGNESRRSARYAFRRHFFQHAGFRYVQSSQEPTVTPQYYETDRQLVEYAEFHYGDEYFNVANFPKALADIAIAACAGRPMRRALDLGCATGRSSFELAKAFDDVTGIDFSARFIDLAVNLATSGSVRYTLVDEGELVSYKTRTLEALGLASNAANVQFSQGDACNLKPHFTGYDLILAANLIDRLYDPAQFTRHIHERLNIGGVLMITSPYTWLTEHTPRADWLGGFKKDGETYTTLDALHEHLSAHFEPLQAAQDVPFVIRETRRKYQHSVSEASFWVRVR
ncbi:5-histidylcysteine sulfoxide synthase/putative 4-mercaptohistidine N1-methyltransferase [Paraperlucidibaca baekdonensis]|uniref:5-histidylcysteine sulfoxide synthase/putative 4-mercaptohistidine N1-methyltransferase n=1 Tax=Paraperlucidibaca baekdonensis TaxID=748120 RepID=A0A3E0H6J1_9GAMM|nr:5-histidylcysteine sulfoxide synthase [Paraperlucidibaca baekdonensis]REH39092.1 5-histidylcysteine sulfoxide synthase/putative 4-mercaptohistidine N1-methyltransferase [Paraperlucidibaca baekdonensis]